MRLTLYIRPDLVSKLKQLAWHEHRQPRQQAEWLLQRAMEDAGATREQRCSIEDDCTEEVVHAER